MKRTILVVAPVASVASVVAWAACSRDAATPPPTGPPQLVAGPAGHWSVAVGTVHVPDEAVAAAVPLLSMRAFDPDEPLEGYGLDPPAATITFTRRTGGTGTVELRLGAENFDGTAYYVQRAGDDRIYLVPDDQLDPVLAAAAPPPR
ncbi:MAG: DUF4340 domain-containing protein [Acidimicrobiales bacterium]